MVFVTGFGQICNNILQFGHFYAWGKENGVKVIAMRFCYKHPFFIISKQKEYNWFTYLFAKYGAKMKLFPTVTFGSEDSVTSERMKLLKQSGFILAEGWYMRDYELFLKNREEIKQLFSFKKKIGQRVGNFMAASIRKGEIRLGLHIRRGDYATWKGGNYFFDDERYLNLVEQFKKLFPDQQVHVFISTNDKNLDIEWYKDRLTPERVSILNGNPGEDLCMLSHCNYLIGPPSTFSLMAAFYNDLPLYWIQPQDNFIRIESFRRFDYLFRHIL